MQSPHEVLEYWFGTGPWTRERLAERTEFWFGGGDRAAQAARDREVRENLEPLLERAARGELAAWASSPKRFHSTTMSDHDQPIAGNVLDRQFVAERPNPRWVGDTTVFLSGSSAKLYLAAIMDLHSRFIVGWALVP